MKKSEELAIANLQDEAGRLAWMSRACREQAKQAKLDGFDAQEWLIDAIGYQERADYMYAQARRWLENKA